MKKSTTGDLLRWYEHNKPLYASTLESINQGYVQGDYAEYATFLITEFIKTFDSLSRYPKALFNELEECQKLIYSAREYFDNAHENCIKVYTNNNMAIPDIHNDIFLSILSLYSSYQQLEKITPGVGLKTIQEFYKSQTY